MTDFPGPIHMGPFVWRISEELEDWEACDADPARLHGYTANQKGIILVHPNGTEEFKRAVVMHEVMHAAVFSTGYVYNTKVTEEDWVLHVAPMLLDALQRSPGLVGFLTGQ